MNPYEQMNPALQWLFEHPGADLFFTIFWMLWVAVALTIICIQLHGHNQREEKKEIMRRYDAERQERENRKNPLRQ